MQSNMSELLSEHTVDLVAIEMAQLKRIEHWLIL